MYFKMMGTGGPGAFGRPFVEPGWLAYLPFLSLFWHMVCTGLGIGGWLVWFV